MPSNLNGAQKNIIEGYLSLPFEMISENLIPAMAIKALQFVMNGELRAAERAEFVKEGVWETIMEIRTKIILHACPQNRCVGDPAVALAVIMRTTPGILPLLLLTQRENLENGIVGDQVFSVENNVIQMDDQGVLGLTAPNVSNGNTVTKTDVVEYVNELIEAEIIRLRAIAIAENAVSRINRNVVVNRHEWALSITQSPADKNYYIYLEGIGKNKVYFMKRFGKVKLGNRMGIDSRSLQPTDPVDKQHQTLVISHRSGNFLKEKIQEDARLLQNAPESSCESCYVFFTNKTNAGQTWIRNMLREIDLDTMIEFTPSANLNNRGLRQIRVGQ